MNVEAERCGRLDLARLAGLDLIAIQTISREVVRNLPPRDPEGQPCYYGIEPLVLQSSSMVERDSSDVNVLLIEATYCCAVRRLTSSATVPRAILTELAWVGLVTIEQVRPWRRGPHDNEILEDPVRPAHVAWAPCHGLNAMLQQLLAQVDVARVDEMHEVPSPS